MAPTAAAWPARLMTGRSGCAAPARRASARLSLRVHAACVHAVACRRDGGRLASGSHDQTVCVWDVEKGREVAALKGHTGPVIAVCFSPDGRRLASAAEDRAVRLWPADRT